MVTFLRILAWGTRGYPFFLDIRLFFCGYISMFRAKVAPKLENFQGKKMKKSKLSKNFMRVLFYVFWPRKHVGTIFPQNSPLFGGDMSIWGGAKLAKIGIFLKKSENVKHFEKFHGTFRMYFGQGKK